MPELSGSYPIEYPAPGAPLVPLENLFLDLAQSVADIMRTNHMAVAVADRTARDLAFPNPVQGDRVFRNDLGYEQVYYGLYSSASNPGGMRTAGWDRFDARMRQSGIVTAVTDSVGDLTITHGLPVTPTGVQAINVASGARPFRLVCEFYATSATTFKVRISRADTGAAYANTETTISWAAFAG